MVAVNMETYKYNSTFSLSEYWRIFTSYTNLGLASVCILVNIRQYSLRLQVLLYTYILHITYYILHITYYILHITYYILHITYYILHITYYILHRIQTNRKKTMCCKRRTNNSLIQPSTSGNNLHIPVSCTDS